MNTVYQKGFTLIEVMVSLAIVGSLVAILYSVLYHMNLLIEQENLLKATLLAKQKIDEPFTGDMMKGNFPPPDERFYFKEELGDTPFPGIKLLKVTVGTDQKDLVTMKKILRLRS